MNKTVGVFWLNAAETWIDISTEDAKKVEFNLLLSVAHRASLSFVELKFSSCFFAEHAGLTNVFLQRGGEFAAD